MIKYYSKFRLCLNFQNNLVNQLNYYQTIKNIQSRIASLLKDKLRAENKLKDARTNTESFEIKIREAEQNRHKYEQELEGLRNNLEKSRLDVNSCQVKIEAVEEQLSQVKRQQLVYSYVGDLIRNGSLHALNIIALTPGEWESQNG